MRKNSHNSDSNNDEADTEDYLPMNRKTSTFSKLRCLCCRGQDMNVERLVRLDGYT